MNPDEPRARVGYQGGAMSRAKQIALKSLLVLGGAVMLASAFVLSVVFLAIGVAVVVIVGGYLWWQTREVRKQLRDRMKTHAQSQPTGRVIEGEVISPERTRR
jgi:hypothetical protein